MTTIKRKPTSIRPGELLRRVGSSPWLYAAPSLVLVLVFFVTPLFLTGWMSLHRWPLFGEREFVGIDNFQFAIGDTVFRESIVFTILYTVVMVVLGTSFGLALALLVHRPGRSARILQTVFFLPVTLGVAAAGYLWFYMLNDQVGIFNHLLTSVGLIDGPIQWLATPRMAFWSIVVMTLWKWVGFPMVILLLGLKTIPDEINEAAAVDGATFWQRTRSITIPLLRPSLALVTVISVLVSALAFDQFFAMTKGGPDGSTVSIVYSIFLNAFQFQNLGYGSAQAVLLLLGLMAVSWFQLRALKDPT